MAAVSWGTMASTKASTRSHTTPARSWPQAPARSACASLSASQGIELHLHERSVRRFRIDLRQCDSVCGLRFGVLARRGENVSLEIREHAGECIVGLDVERLQRFVVLLFIEHRLCQAEAGDRLQLLL